MMTPFHTNWKIVTKNKEYDYKHVIINFAGHIIGNQLNSSILNIACALYGFSISDEEELYYERPIKDIIDLCSVEQIIGLIIHKPAEIRKHFVSIENLEYMIENIIPEDSEWFPVILYYLEAVGIKWK